MCQNMIEEIEKKTRKKDKRSEFHLDNMIILTNEDTYIESACITKNNKDHLTYPLRKSPAKRIFSIAHLLCVVLSSHQG